MDVSISGQDLQLTFNELVTSNYKEYISFSKFFTSCLAIEISPSGVSPNSVISVGISFWFFMPKQTEQI